MRGLAAVLGGVAVIVALLIFAATVAIPFAAPPPNRPGPTLPAGALMDCPRMVAGCR